MKKLIYAYCGTDGAVKFGDKVPEGMQEIYSGYGKKFKDQIQVKCRLAHRKDKNGNNIWLVPGIPEADHEILKMNALMAFRMWIDLTYRMEFMSCLLSWQNHDINAAFNLIYRSGEDFKKFSRYVYDNIQNHKNNLTMAEIAENFIKSICHDKQGETRNESNKN